MKNKDFLSISKEFGTPVYVYDSQVIAKQLERLKKVFNSVESLSIKYAVKALSNINILKLIVSLGSGLDTVSKQEVELSLKAGCDPKDIIYTPNGVSLEEIIEVSKMEVQINIDNLSILEQFGVLCPDIPVCIRINPHVMAGGNDKISVGHMDSKFGISIYQLPHVLKVVKATGLKINGLHMHTGSDILDVEVFLRASEILFDAAKNFGSLEFLDFGSGFKVPYKDNDPETNVEELGERLSKRFNNFCKTYGSPLKLFFEPGKFLVSQAGYFLAKVNVVKQTTSSVFLGIDTGFNHLVRPMFYDAKHHIENISNLSEKKRFYSVVGYICETDTFASNVQMSETFEGDILCFRNAGAYCFTMSSNYNSRLRPPEVLYHKGKAILIRKRETLDDLLNNQIEVVL